MTLLAVYAAYVLVCVGVTVAAHVTPAQHRFAERPWVVAAFIGTSAVLLWVTDTPWFGDFSSAYYPAGGRTANPVTLYARDCVSGFVNIPIVALLFVPFARLDYAVAATAFLVCGLVAIALSIALLWRDSARTGKEKLGVVALFTLAGPLFYSVREGNTSHIIFPLAILGLALWWRGSGGLAGICLAIASVIKPPLAIFGLYFLLRREWRIAGSMLLTAAGVVAASVVVMGAESHYAWFDACIAQTAGKPIAAFNVQSVDGFLSRLSGGGLRDWTPMTVGETYQRIRLAALFALTTMVVSVLWRAGASLDRSARLTEFCIVLVFAVVTFPVSWTHYYVWCLLPLAMIMTGDIRLREGRAEWVAVAVSALLILLPLRTPPTAPDHGWLHLALSVFPASHAFLGGLALLAILLRSRQAGKAAERRAVQ